MKIIITLGYALFLALSAVQSVKAQTMTLFETKMIEIETERLKLQREGLEEQKLTGIYVRCKALQIGPLFSLESCIKLGGKFEQSVAVSPVTRQPF